MTPPGAQERTLPATPPSVARARAVAREFARAHGVDRETVDAIELCVSEAATNAVEHAFLDRPPGTITVAAGLAEDEVVVRVVDDGCGMRPRADSPGLGLGLPTIARLTRALDVQAGRDGRGTEVRMTFAAPGLAGPPAPGPPGDRVLAEVAELLEDGSWPDEGVDRLPAAIVPALSDACALDVVDADGVPRRVAGRLAPPATEADSRWLATLRPRVETPFSGTRAALVDRRPSVVELTPERIAAISYREEDAERMRATGIRWWVVVPMLVDGRPLGLLHFGARRERAPFSDAEVDAFSRLAARAAGGLARSALVHELERTREQLGHVVGAVEAAVFVQDADDAVVYANEAAARTLGHASARELLGAPASAVLAGREVVRDDDDRSVGPDDLPARRVLLGRPSDALACRVRDRATGTERRLLVTARGLPVEGWVVTTLQELGDARDGS